MLDTDTERRIDTARDILVGKVPDQCIAGVENARHHWPQRHNCRIASADFPGLT